MSALLQELLNLGLVEIDDSDERFSHLDKASASIANTLRAAPGEAIQHLLVAIDHTTLDDEPVLELAERAVMEHWKLLRRRYTERPRTLLRFVVFDALDRAAADDEYVRMSATFTAAPLLDHVSLGREADVVRRTIGAWARAVEDTAAEAWQSALTLPSKPESKSPKLVTPKAPTFSASQFQAAVERTAGPNNAQGQAIPGANPHWPHNNPQGWRDEFATRMTAAFVTAANLISEDVTKATSQVVADGAKQWSAAAAPIAAFALDVAEAVAASQRAALLRVDLLWWKEALYSPSAGVSYRTMPPAAAGLLMAHDVLERISVPAPQSVVAYLRETAAALAGRGRRPLSEWISELGNNSPARAIIAAPPERSGRLPLADLLRKSLHAPLSLELLESRVGVKPSLELSLADLVAWFFYDEQAARAARVVHGG